MNVRTSSIRELNTYVNDCQRELLVAKIKLGKLLILAPDHNFKGECAQKYFDYIALSDLIQEKMALSSQIQSLLTQVEQLERERKQCINEKKAYVKSFDHIFLSVGEKLQALMGTVAMEGLESHLREILGYMAEIKTIEQELEIREYENKKKGFIHSLLGKGKSVFMHAVIHSRKKDLNDAHIKLGKTVLRSDMIEKVYVEPFISLIDLYKDITLKDSTCTESLAKIENTLESYRQDLKKLCAGRNPNYYVYELAKLIKNTELQKDESLILLVDTYLESPTENEIQEFQRLRTDIGTLIDSIKRDRNLLSRLVASKKINMLVIRKAHYEKKLYAAENHLKNLSKTIDRFKNDITSIESEIDILQSILDKDKKDVIEKDDFIKPEL